ncbi:MAG: hypothetical protein H6578_03215 [Chitinophagales bacterium]|nr:hypothetical protein [Chitinophagales bacterium]
MKHTTWSGSDAAKLIIILLQFYIIVEVVFILSFELGFNDWFYNFYKSGKPTIVIIIAGILLSIINGLYYNEQREEMFIEKWGGDSKIIKRRLNGHFLG